MVRNVQQIHKKKRSTRVVPIAVKRPPLTKRTWNWFKQLPKLKKFFVVLLAILLAYLVVVRPIQILLERRDFEMAYDYISDISGDIQKATGPASATETDKSCGYASAKFERGRLGCSVEVTLRYDGVDVEKANEIARNVSKSLKNASPLTSISELDYFIPPLTSRSKVQYLSQSINTDDNHYYVYYILHNDPQSSFLKISLLYAQGAMHPHYKIHK